MTEQATVSPAVKREYSSKTTVGTMALEELNNLGAQGWDLFIFYIKKLAIYQLLIKNRLKCASANRYLRLNMCYIGSRQRPTTGGLLT